jgi:hypothetical protein
MTEKERAMTLGDWAWKYHPEIFQYPRAYIRLVSSTPSRMTREAGASTAEEEDGDGVEEEDEDE